MAVKYNVLSLGNQFLFQDNKTSWCTGYASFYYLWNRYGNDDSFRNLPFVPSLDSVKGNHIKVSKFLLPHQLFMIGDD